MPRQAGAWPPARGTAAPTPTSPVRLECACCACSPTHNATGWPCTGGRAAAAGPLVGAIQSALHEGHTTPRAHLLRLQPHAHRHGQAVRKGRAAAAGQGVHAPPRHGNGLGGREQHLGLLAVKGHERDLRACVHVHVCACMRKCMCVCLCALHACMHLCVWECGKDEHLTRHSWRQIRTLHLDAQLDCKKQGVSMHAESLHAHTHTHTRAHTHTWSRLVYDSDSRRMHAPLAADMRLSAMDPEASTTKRTSAPACMGVGDTADFIAWAEARPRDSCLQVPNPSCTCGCPNERVRARQPAC